MKERDVSFRSMSILERRFTSYRGRAPWVPDWGIVPPPGSPPSDEVLLMGSYFERVFQPQYWPTHEFSLYCLCTKVRDVLEQVFHFEPDSVGTLSRYSLFPLPERWKQEPEPGEDTILYYGGRLSPQKNVEFLVFVAFYAQLHVSERIRLVLIGDWDNEYHKNILGCRFTDYRRKIESLLSFLPWPGERPRIHSGLGQETWKEAIPEGGLYLSASTLISEDFSVVAAELQERGLPLILPDWGGFSDVRGENVRFYPRDRIGTSHETLEEIGRKAESFVRELFRDPGALRRAALPAKAEDRHPAMRLSHQDLADIRDRNRRAWGAEIELLSRGELSQFVATGAGQRLFARIEEIFLR